MVQILVVFSSKINSIDKTLLHIPAENNRQGLKSLVSSYYPFVSFDSNSITKGSIFVCYISCVSISNRFFSRRQYQYHRATLERSAVAYVQCTLDAITVSLHDREADGEG